MTWRPEAGTSTLTLTTPPQDYRVILCETAGPTDASTTHEKERTVDSWCSHQSKDDLRKERSMPAAKRRN
jgi:hypothetical protein